MERQHPHCLSLRTPKHQPIDKMQLKALLALGALASTSLGLGINCRGSGRCEECSGALDKIAKILEISIHDGNGNGHYATGSKSHPPPSHHPPHVLIQNHQQGQSPAPGPAAPSSKTAPAAPRNRPSHTSARCKPTAAKLAVVTQRNQGIMSRMGS